MGKTAAINLEEAIEKPVGELSAIELLQVLGNPKVKVDLQLIADKKKYELWVEEGGLTKIKVRDLIERLQGEKKKVELELPPELGRRPNPFDGRFGGSYEKLVSDVAIAVSDRLKGGVNVDG